MTKGYTRGPQRMLRRLVGEDGQVAPEEGRREAPWSLLRGLSMAPGPVAWLLSEVSG